MNSQDMTTEQRLNALADGELDQADSEELLGLIEQDVDLRGELCDIHRIKDMLHYAYPVDEKKNSSSRPLARKGIGWGVAATFLFTLGALVGNLVTQEAEQITPFSLAQVEQQQPNKVVLYINESDENKFQQTLDKAEYLLKTGYGEDVEVNIVASAGGIEMLRNRASPFTAQIKSLADNYDTLQFVACSKTIARQKLEGKPVNLVHEVRVAPSAVEFIVGRLQDGWSYVAI